MYNAEALAEPLDDISHSYLRLSLDLSCFRDDSFIGTSKKNKKIIKSKWVQDLPPGHWIAPYLPVVFVRLLKINSRVIHLKPLKVVWQYSIPVSDWSYLYLVSHSAVTQFQAKINSVRAFCRKSKSPLATDCDSGAAQPVSYLCGSPILLS